jgi:hypothetical protein
MGRVPMPVRGNVVRLRYSDSLDVAAYRKFIDLMYSEGSAVSVVDSEVTQVSRKTAHQVRGIFYWNGCALTHSTGGIELHAPEDPEPYIARLSSHMGVKFKRQTVRNK